MKLLPTYILLGLPLLLGASDPSKTTTPSTDQQTPQTLTLHCPEPNTLVKSPDPTKMNWTAPGPGGWKSYSISFTKKIARFVGAQWKGISVGELGCVYQGENKLTFKIELVFGSLTLEPKGHSWGKNIKGLRNCYSNDVKDCPFAPRIDQQVKDPNETLKNIKENTQANDINSDQPSF